MQSKLLMVAAIAVAAWSMPLHATTHKEAPDMKAEKSQGSKLGACSKEAAAKGLKGEERNKYLSECGKGGGAAAQKTQGKKLGECSKEAAAKGLKGDERNKYLSECAKGA